MKFTTKLGWWLVEAVPFVVMYNIAFPSIDETYMKTFVFMASAIVFALLNYAEGRIIGEHVAYDRCNQILDDESD